MPNKEGQNSKFSLAGRFKIKTGFNKGKFNNHLKNQKNN